MVYSDDGRDFERKQKIDRAVMGLCFLLFATVGYFLAYYIIF